MTHDEAIVITEKCDQLAANRKAIHDKFMLEDEQMCMAAGLIFTSADREADAEKLSDCKKILKKQVNIFSKLRSMTEIVVISKMALSENPEDYLNEVKRAYKVLRDAGFEDSSYLVQACLLICDLGVSDECEEIARKAKEILKRLNKNHPILTSAEDTSSAVLLAVSYKDVDTLIRDFEEGYEYLTKEYKLRVSKNSVQEVCEHLAITYGDMRTKCDAVARLYDEFRTRRSGQGKDMRFAALGLLTDTGLSPEETVDAVMDAAEYLKEKEGFRDKDQKDFGQKRMMYAALLVADIYGRNSDMINNPAIGNAITDIHAKRTAQAVSVTANVIANLIPALLGSESDEPDEGIGSEAEE